MRWTFLYVSHSRVVNYFTETGGSIDGFTNNRRLFLNYQGRILHIGII